jgi:hypothetical protein
MKWTAGQIGHSLYYHVFAQKHAVVLENCYYPGSECDILIVRNDLRLMEIEIKISRGDLRADAKKDKWFKRIRPPGDRDRWPPAPQSEWTVEKIEWPNKIWKHYYACPEEIWTPELAADIPLKSGVLLMRESSRGGPYTRVERQAKPNKDAKPMPAADLIDIARYCNVRMWDALQRTRESVEAVT